jgi:hypothetical protein
MTELATIVATVKLPEGVTPADLRGAVADALDRVGARLAPCGWAPDPDTVAEQCNADTVAVVDLNPALA